MTIGLDKYKISAMEKGKWKKRNGYEVSKEQGTLEGKEETEH